MMPSFALFCQKEPGKLISGYETELTCSNVEVFAPFPVDSISHSVHKTYLDTTGRPEITIKKSGCTEKHAQPIYITYEYPLSAQLQKPLAVSAVLTGLFLLGAGMRRVDFGINEKR
jgi:oligosaccharyltransferase complex subunit alpha (ribophorin I)